MEVGFCVFFNFFTQPSQENQREHGQPPKKGNSVRHKPLQKEGRTAEEQKIEDRAQKEGCRHIDTQLSAAGGDGVEKESGGHQDPKEEIQRRTQQGQPDPAAQDTKEVVHQAQGGPQQGGPQKGHGLVQ